jgi:hypothetical protein
MAARNLEVNGMVKNPRKDNEKDVEKGGQAHDFLVFMGEWSSLADCSTL